MMYHIEYMNRPIYGNDPEDTLLDVSIDEELNSAGTLTFTIPVENEYAWNNIEVFKSEVRVYEGDDIIWFGRPLQIVRNWNNQKVVTCEGALAYFNDTVQATHTYEKLPLYTHPDYQSGKKGFINTIVDLHNDQVKIGNEDYSRQIFIGVIDVDNETNIYREVDYQTTAEVLQQMCLNTNGGYFILRKEFDSEINDYKTYLDWRKEVPYGTTQKIVFGENLLELNQDLNGSDICTALIAMGNNDKTVAGLTAYADEEHAYVMPSGNELYHTGEYIYHKQGYEKYGRVLKVKDWSDIVAESQEGKRQLFIKAAEWLEDQNTEITTIECSAADLHYCPDPDKYDEGKLRIGQLVTVSSPIHGLPEKRLPIYKISMDLSSGAKKITIGTPPKRELTDIVKSKGGSTRGSSGTTGGGGSGESGGGSGGGTSTDIPVKDVLIKEPGDEKFKTAVKKKKASIDISGYVKDVILDGDSCVNRNNGEAVIDVPVKGVVVDGNSVVNEDGIAVIDTSELSTLKLEDIFWRSRIDRSGNPDNRSKTTETIVTTAGYYCAIVYKGDGGLAFKTPPWSDNYTWIRAYRNNNLITPIMTKKLGVDGQQLDHLDVTPVSTILAFYNLKIGDRIVTYNELNYYYPPVDISEVINPKEQGLYEYSEETYFYELSEDTSPDISKTYYSEPLGVDYCGVEWIFRIKNFDLINDNFLCVNSRVESSHVSEGSSISVVMGYTNNTILNTELFSKNDDNVYLIIKIAGSNGSWSTRLTVGDIYVPAIYYNEDLYQELKSFYTNDEHNKLVHIGGNTIFGNLSDSERYNDDEDLIYYCNENSHPVEYNSASTVAYAEIVSGKDILSNTNLVGSGKDVVAFVIQLSEYTDDFVTKDELSEYIVGNPDESPDETLTKLKVDDTVYSIPSGGGGTTVIPNPQGETPTDDLETVKIGDVVYDIPSGGGGSEVEANPIGEPSSRLIKLGVDGVVYSVSDGGGGDQSIDYDYSGHVDTFIAPKTGTYKLEVWGAQGGQANADVHGGYGGYSVGDISLTAGDTLYICVGGKGGGTYTSDSNVVGYNGGGEANYGGDRGNGGGATHIATRTGLLNTLSTYQSDILIVAGGGGGSGQYSSEHGDGGSGGGYIGGDGEYDDWATDTNHIGTGGTQSAGGETDDYSGQSHGSFGQGASRDDGDLWGGSGGGGGFYGGGASTNNAGAGGGSGYINTTELTDAAMYGYSVSESAATATKTISVNTHSSDAVSQYAKEGNGYARISWNEEYDPYVTVGDLYNACVANNVTPASKTLDAIIAAILSN